MNLNLVKNIAEEINEEFRTLVQADVTTKGNIQLTCKLRRYMEMEELEEMLSGVFEYVAEKYGVDFSIANYYKNALIVEVYEC